MRVHVAVLAAAVLASACDPTVATTSEIALHSDTLDQRLVGLWAPINDANNRWDDLQVFRILPEKERAPTSYRLSAIPDYDPSPPARTSDSWGLSAQATTLGGRLILDVWQAGDVYLRLPVHVPCYVSFVSPDTLEIRFLNGDSIEAVLQRDPSAVPHIPDNASVLTGSTDQVRQFLIRVQAMPGFFSRDIVRLRRLY